MSYTIGEIAEIINESTHTLRYYDKEGLLPFSKRDKAGRRVYTEDDLELFQVIQCLKKTGMPLKEIARFMKVYLQGDKKINKRKNIFAERKAIVDQEIKELKELRAYLDYVGWFLGKAEVAGTINIKYELKDKEVTAKFKKMKARYDQAHTNK